MEHLEKITLRKTKTKISLSTMKKKFKSKRDLIQLFLTKGIIS